MTRRAGKHRQGGCTIVVAGLLAAVATLLAVVFG